MLLMAAMSPTPHSSAWNAKTGKVVWREEPEWEESLTLNGETRKYVFSTMRGCLLHVDGQFLCVGEWGHLLWLDLNPDGYKQLQRTWLFAAQETWALPVISRGFAICDPE